MQDHDYVKLCSAASNAVSAVFPPNAQRWLKEYQRLAAMSPYTRIKRLDSETVRRHLFVDRGDEELCHRIWKTASINEAITLLHAMLRGLWLLFTHPGAIEVQRLREKPSARLCALVGLETFITHPSRRSATIMDEFPDHEGRLVPGPPQHAENS